MEMEVCLLLFLYLGIWPRLRDVPFVFNYICYRHTVQLVLSQLSLGLQCQRGFAGRGGGREPELLGLCAKKHEGFSRFINKYLSCIRLLRGEEDVVDCRAFRPTESVFGRRQSFVASQRFMARHRSAFHSLHPCWMLFPLACCVPDTGKTLWGVNDYEEKNKIKIILIVIII